MASKKLLDNLVNKIYRNAAPLLVGEACLYGVIGVLMLVRPITMLSALTFAIGAGLIVFGLYRVGMVFVSNIGASVGFFDVFVGLMTLVLGLIFCIFPSGAATGIIYVFLILFLLNALRVLAFSVNMARAGFGHYYFDMWMAIVMLCLVVALLFVPNLVGGALVWLLGLYLLIYAVLDVYMLVKLLRLRALARTNA
ncbi:MAG: DUF308 domain-containing protein [Alphaproteobacteria bacterium]|nr:DUF308 domain-containing protein [Alphaproteobacteria bacterium]